MGSEEGLLLLTKIRMIIEGDDTGDSALTKCFLGVRCFVGAGFTKVQCAAKIISRC